jgi:hypothetical protein
LEIHTFGDRNARQQNTTIRIDRRHKAVDIARQVRALVESLPSKHLKPQKKSQILAFLEFGQFQCDKGSTIILLSDGIEDSPSIRAKDLLRGKPLPKPDANILKGCAVVMRGFASGKPAPSDAAVKAMRRSWSDYMKIAGATFTPIIDP